MTPQIVELLQGRDFFAVKGLLGVTATVILVFHMIHIWGDINRWSQRLRYIALLYCAAFFTTLSTDQIQRRVEDINLRNIGGMVGAILITAAAVASLAADHMDRKRGRTPSESDRHLVQ